MANSNTLGEIPPRVVVLGEKGASDIALFLLGVISVAFGYDWTHDTALSRVKPLIGCSAANIITITQRRLPLRYCSQSYHE